MSDHFIEASEVFASWAVKADPSLQEGTDFFKIRKSQSAKYILSEDISSIDEYYWAGVDLIKLRAFVPPYEWCYFELDADGDIICLMVDRYEPGRLYVWPGFKYLPEDKWEILEPLNFSDEFILRAAIKGKARFKEEWGAWVLKIAICCVAAAITNGPVFKFVPPADPLNPLSKKVMH